MAPTSFVTELYFQRSCLCLGFVKPMSISNSWKKASRLGEDSAQRRHALNLFDDALILLVSLLLILIGFVVVLFIFKQIPPKKITTKK